MVGSGPHYYVVTDVWTFIPDHHKRSSLHLYNLGTNFNSINTIELHLKSFDPLPATREPAIIFDNFIYGGRLA